MPADDPIEVRTDHRCFLGGLTDRLAEAAREGKRGDELADVAVRFLAELDAEEFAGCCGSAYLALAPEVFEREVQLPIASADIANIDTRVLLWPVGASDRQHPHGDGWAAVMAMQGRLAATETRDGSWQPERLIELHAPELIVPEDGVSHHIHNRGSDVGLTIHVFGK
jgi:hypothetical protein